MYQKIILIIGAWFLKKEKRNLIQLKFENSNKSRTNPLKIFSTFK